MILKLIIGIIVVYFLYRLIKAWKTGEGTLPSESARSPAKSWWRIPTVMPMFP